MSRFRINSLAYVDLFSLTIHSGGEYEKLSGTMIRALQGDLIPEKKKFSFLKAYELMQTDPKVRFEHRGRHYAIIDGHLSYWSAGNWFLPTDHMRDLESREWVQVESQ